MHAKVCKWENSLAICIPEVLAAQTCLEEGMDVEIMIVDGKVSVAPEVKQYDLSELLAAVTPSNLHGEIETGNAVGREAW